MEAKEKEILRELISGNKLQFVIPVFQRNYDWREKDCRRLFDDVIDLAKDESHQDRQHFLGAFVYKFNRIVETQFIEYILIDGQQRLTSVTLMLKALYDYLGELGDQYNEMRDEINETYLINKFAKSYCYRLKLKPNELDNDNYTKLIDDDSTIDVSSTIYRNYSSFKNWIKSMDVSVENFYSSLQRLEAVGVQLDDNDNPQLIFESLNSTGLELTDVDLIRNYLLMNCDSEMQTRLYKEYWLKLEQLLGDNFLQYVRDFLSLKNGSVTSSSKNMVYNAFQKYYCFLNIKAESFLSEFLENAKTYNRLLVPSSEGKGKLDIALNDYITLDMKTTYPFVFGLMLDNRINSSGEQKISDDSLSDILRVLESYLIRRNVCNLAGGGMSQVMASLYNSLKEKCGENLYNNPVQIISMALVGISTKAYFPSNDEFVREFTERDMFKNRNIEFILDRFERFEQQKELVNLENLTIEHIIPQTLSNEWKKYLNYSLEELLALQKEFINRIGNLTLTAYNPEMSNKLFNEKKQHVDFSRLVLNQYFKDLNEWNKNSIVERGEKLASLALKIWPYPKVKNVESLYKECHFLFDEADDFEYAGTTPTAIKIKDNDFLVTSWQDVFIDFFKFYYMQNSELFVSLFTKPGLISQQKSLISTNKDDFEDPQELVNGLYIELYVGGTERKIKLLRDAMNLLQVDSSDLIVFFD